MTQEVSVLLARTYQSLSFKGRIHSFALQLCCLVKVRMRWPMEIVYLRRSFQNDHQAAAFLLHRNLWPLITLPRLGYDENRGGKDNELEFLLKS